MNPLRKTKPAAPAADPPDADNGQVPALSRALAILRLLGKSEAPLGINEMARMLDLVPSTVLHILRVLAAHELVVADSTKKYRLDAGLLTLSRSLLRPNSFGSLIQPVLDRLSDELNVLAVGSRILGLDHFVIVATSRPRTLRLHVEVGTRVPGLMSATGQCFAAFSSFPEAKLKRAFERLKWERAPTFEQWLRDVERTRSLRYAVDRGRYIEGMTSIAAPVLDRAGAMTHGMERRPAWH